MILSAKEIGLYIDEFKKISYDDIINRNSYLSIEEIDTSIKELSDDTAIDNILIKQELHDLMQMLDSGHNLNSLFDFDAEDAETFKKYIIQIKINALSEVKKTLQKTLPQISHALHASAPTTNGVTIKDAIQEYINSKSGISKAVIEQDILNLNRFLEYTDIKSILYVDALKHNDLIEFRKYRQKLNPKSKPNTINRIMANVSTFVKYCVKVDHLHKDIAKDIKLKLTIKEKLDTKRDVYEDMQIKKIFDNIDLIKQSPKKKKLRKYHNEYPLIIKLAMYSGAREQELCQLTKKDIKVEDGIHYMDLNIDTEGSSIKNIFSIRKVPIHPDILQELLAYMKPLKRDNLFTIPASQFSIDYGAFKTLLGFDRKLVFHSFRNTLQNKLKQQKVQNMIINELVGHSSVTSEKMTDGYTNKYNLEILHEELLKVKYEYV
ncbi:MAG: tyrosine-type recombinase/integrase [Sulfurimonas sp.]